jgi:hypothetical protein
MAKKAHNKNRRFLSTPSNRKAQIQIVFNWVYILIAGAVILLFFLGLVVRQKNISEEVLASDVIRIMESIFTSAQVSEKTKSSIPLGGLSDKTLYFECEEGVSQYGVKDFPARVENSLDAIFAPSETQGSRLLLWSLPYSLPFKITDFLFVTSINHRYYFMGEGNGFTEEFIEGAFDSDEKLNIHAEKVSSLSQINVNSNKLKIRIVDADGSFISEGVRIPDNLLRMEDNDLTAVSFTANKEVNFFMKNGVTWRKLNLQPITIVSDGGRRDPVKYGAVFTEDPDIYLCNMQKAYLRIRLIAEVYEGKAAELKTFYTDGSESANCLGFVSGFTASEGNLNNTLLFYKTRAKACSILADSSCNDIVDFSGKLKVLNEKIAEECSVGLY